MTRRIAILGLALAAALSGPAPLLHALEVDEVAPPRLTVDVEVFSTLDYRRQWPVDGTPTSAGEASLDDTSVTLVLDKPLYDLGLVAGAAATLDLEREAVVPRAHAFIGGGQWRLSAGRLALPVGIVRLPTVRDDDLSAYTQVRNGARGLEGSAAHRYADAVQVDWRLWPSPWRLTLYGAERSQTRFDTATAAYVADEAAQPNSAGLLLGYEPLPAARYDHRVRRFGLLYDTQTLTRGDGMRARQGTAVLGLVVGVNDNPEAPWELALQWAGTGGLDDRDATGAPLRATTEDALAREAASAVVAALHFAERQYLQTRWRAALSLAHKRYADLPEATQWSVVPAWFHGIGNGVELVAQVAYTAYGEGLRALLGRERELAVQVGLTFAFEAAFNDTVVEPGTILETEFGRTFERR